MLVHSWVAVVEYMRERIEKTAKEYRPQHFHGDQPFSTI
jgi:hypothetical protein